MIRFFSYSFFRQDYLRHDFANDPTVTSVLNEEERQTLLKSLSSSTMSRATVVKNKRYESEEIQTIGYMPLDTSPPSLITQSCFTKRLQEKYRDFPISSFYFNQSNYFDYHLKQQIRNYDITRVHSTEYFSIKRTLLNIILKVFGDRSEMAHSVEGRTPFLDHHLVDYANHLPTNMKLKLINGKLIEKYILKEAAQPYITEEVYQREKHPFLAPPTFLNRNSKINQYVHETLNSRDMKDLEHIFNIEQIRKNLNQLQHRQEHMENKLQLRELVALEGFHLMLCSYVTLKKRFNVQNESV
jgi:asparagine synthase (glutamine-hydrolysing)